MHCLPSQTLPPDSYPMGGAIGISLALLDIKSRWRVNLIVHIGISRDNFRA